MKDDLENQLRKLSPAEATPQFRARVLTAVSKELRSPRRKTHIRPLWSVAAAVLVGFGLNVWSFNADVARQDPWLRRPTPRAVTEVAEAVGSVTDPETQRRVERQLSAARRQEPIDPEELERAFREIQASLGEAARAPIPATKEKMS